MFTVYKTTNRVNGRYYLGVHKTSNPQDRYLGSGVVLRLALKKYGREMFSKEVLFTYPDAASAFAKEAELVKHALGDPQCMNLKDGGHGGFEFVNQNALNDRSGETRTEEQRRRIGTGVSRSYTEERKLEQSQRMLGKRIGVGNRGRTTPLSDEHREKIRQAVLRTTSIYEEVTCPVCGKTGAKNAMRRWHFDNCKTTRD